MKLLILGLILIGIVLIQIYYVKKNKEGFNKSLDNMLEAGEYKWNNREEFSYSRQANKRRNWKKERKDYWVNRAKADTTQANTIEVNPGTTSWLEMKKIEGFESTELVNKNIDTGMQMGALENSIKNCRQIESCDDLQEGGNCGYCALDEEFRRGNDTGPFAHVCEPKYWTKDAETCKKIKRKKECSEAKDCGDLTGDKAEKCGFCPTTGKIVPMEKIGETYHAMYDDDICPNYDGLLPADECASFAKENPCITPYHSTGPHNTACLKRLWKNSKCTTDKPYSKTFIELSKIPDYIGKSFNAIGSMMSDTFVKTKSVDIIEAKSNSVHCFGDSNNIDVCDEKYYKDGIPHPECLQKKFLEAGCSRGSSEFAIIGNDVKAHVKKMNSYKIANERYTSDGVIYKGNGSDITTIDDYVTDIQRIYGLASSAENEETRMETSNLCFGKEPPPSPPVKNGDTVTLGPLPVEEGILKFEGIVMGKKNGKFRVLWTKSTRNGIERKREDMSQDDQKRFFGWDGIKPTYNKKLDAFFLPGRLRVISSCSTNKSACKVTCYSKRVEALNKYPRPRDCIVSDWGSLSACSKECGGGKQYRTRSILYEARAGGKPCPTLKVEYDCNEEACVRDDFKLDRGVVNAEVSGKSSGTYKTPNSRKSYYGYMIEKKNLNMIPKTVKLEGYVGDQGWGNSTRGLYIRGYKGEDSIFSESLVAPRTSGYKKVSGEWDVTKHNPDNRRIDKILVFAYSRGWGHAIRAKNVSFTVSGVQ